ncbi:patatin-like phospholipase family protein [Chloroflexota bacterium]
MRKRKVGLALGGGVARGLAHIGVLAVLEKEAIPIDMIAGTSAGAVVGALYTQGKDTTQMKKLTRDLGWKKLAPLADISLPKTGFIRGNKIKDMLASSFGSDIQFGDLTIPFACVATDIDSGEEVVINQGSVTEAIRASISIPAIFTIVQREGRYLVDGGLVNPVPVNVVKRMGADFIIAVNIIPDVTDRAHWESKKVEKEPKEPNILHIITQSIYITTYALARSSSEEADIVIEPEVSHIGAGDFHRAQELVLRGVLAAQVYIPEIKRQLKNL